MLQRADIVWFVAGSSGTNDFSDGTGLPGARNLAGGATAGQSYTYRAEHPSDKTIWENGYGPYSGGVLVRNVTSSSAGGTTKVNFAVVPIVLLTTMKLDWDELLLSALDNMAINGGIDVSQEHGPSIKAVDTGFQSIYVADQWRIEKTGTSVLGGQQVASGISGIPRALQVLVTTAQAAIGSDSVSLRQPIEGYRFARAGWGAAGAQDVSVAFWFKAPVTGSFLATIYNDGFGSSAGANFTVNAANTWELKVIKLAGVTSGTWLTTNGVGGLLVITLAAAGLANVVANTSYVTMITGVVVIPGVDLTALDQTVLAARLPLLMRPFDAESGAVPPVLPKVLQLLCCARLKRRRRQQPHYRVRCDRLNVGRLVSVLALCASDAGCSVDDVLRLGGHGRKGILL